MTSLLYCPKMIVDDDELPIKVFIKNIVLLSLPIFKILIIKLIQSFSEPYLEHHHDDCQRYSMRIQ